MLRFDAVTFMAYLDNLRATEGVKSVWLFHSGGWLVAGWQEGCMAHPSGKLHGFCMHSACTGAPARAWAWWAGLFMRIADLLGPLMPLSLSPPHPPSHAPPSSTHPAAAHAIFEAAKSRVYRLKQQGSGTDGGTTGAQAQPRTRKQAGGGTGEGEAAAAGAAAKPAATMIEAVLESMPKWDLLREVGSTRSGCRA